RLHFEQRLHVLDGFLEHRQGVAAFRFFCDVFHGFIENRLRRGALAVIHHARNKLLYQIASVDGVSGNLPANYESLAWHFPDSPTFVRPWAVSRRISSAPACGSQ